MSNYRFQSLLSKSQASKRYDFPKMLEKAQTFLGRDDIHVAIRVGKIVFDVTKTYLENPKWYTAAFSATKLVSGLLDEFSIDTGVYFRYNSRWKTFTSSTDVSDLIVKVLMSFGKPTTLGENNKVKACFITVDNLDFGWILTEGGNVDEYVYVRGHENVQRAKDLIKKLFAEVYKDGFYVATSSRPKNGQSQKILLIEKLKVNQLPHTSTFNDYTRYINKYINKGITRSVMLYGPPGTGKSTMAKYIAHTLNLRTFCIHVKDMSEFENEVIYDLVEIFAPESIILDDFDRSTDQTRLLDELEFINRNVKLTIATVNDVDKLDDALVRPGRFDELVEVDHLDEDAIRVVLGDYNDEIDLVRNWPIVFIIEYVKRRSVLSKEESKNVIIELAGRIDKIRKNMSNTDDVRVDKIIDSKSDDDNND